MMIEQSSSPTSSLPPWKIYASAAKPASSVGPLLSYLLFLQVCLADGHGPEEISTAFDKSDAGSAKVRASIFGAIDLFRTPLMDGRFATFSRPFGGGKVTPIPPAHWELDNLLPRFAYSAYDPLRPYDADAPPTAWIFADHTLEATICDLHSDEPINANLADARSPEQRQPPSDPQERGQEVLVGAEGLTFLRRPQVEKMTGLAKSTIYERIDAGTFPDSEPIGTGRAVGWRLADILRWLENPR